ncbi:MAG: Uma2 family endonuclease [Actinomycetes bacterium]
MVSMVTVPASITLPIRPDGFTVDDLDALPETGSIRYELVDGTLLVSPAARHRHQLAIGDLVDVLKAACPPDLVVVPAAQDVRGGPRTSLQPDLLVERLADIDLDAHVAPAPLLVVEVISPSSRRFDLLVKREVYAEMGVPSYWVLHPAEDWVKVFELRHGEYDEVASAQGDDLLRVERPFPVTFRPTDLLARFRGNA